MIVNEEKENEKQTLEVENETCMVLGGGNIPTKSNQFLIGMEHDKPSSGMYGAVLQNSSSNGISELIDDTQMMDDDAEIEAAAAQSEMPMPVVVNPPTSVSFKPLHVQVNGFSGSGSGSEPSSSNSGPRTVNEPVNSSQHPYYPSPQAFKNRPPPISTSNRAPRSYISQRAGPSSNIVMGPPSSASSLVQLSPAANPNNGFLRSGESSPSSPAGYTPRFTQKREPFVHPLATSSSSLATSAKASPLATPPHRLQSTNPFRSVSSSESIAATIGLVSSGGGSTGSSTSSTPGRRDAETHRRRMIGDKISYCRSENKLTTFLASMDTQTDVQMAMFTRKVKNQYSKDLPLIIRNDFFDEQADDVLSLMIPRRLRESAIMRFRNQDIDEITDISEDEEEESVVSRAKRKDLGPAKVPVDKLEWNEHKMKLGSMIAAAEACMEDRVALHNSLECQLENLNKSSGCRFANEEPQPRKRRHVDGQIQLMVQSPFERKGTEEYGCARSRPLKSWTSRALFRDIFQDKKRKLSIFDPNEPGCSTSDEVLPKYDYRNVAIGSHQVVTTMNDGEKRETVEYEYRSYEEGKGMVEIRNVGENDVKARDVRTIEDRLLSYYYRLAVAPKMVTRTSFDRPMYLDSGADEKVRSGASRQIVKRAEKSDRKRERRMAEDGSSDEEDWKNESRLKKKRGRGRPVKAQKKPAPVPTKTRGSNANRNNRPDFGLDDFYLDDSVTVALPQKMTYAHIYVPQWHPISDDYWNEDGGEKSNVVHDELWKTVAEDHHKLMFLERERIKRETEKLNRNRMSTMRQPGSATPAREDAPRESIDEDVLLQQLEPFDLNKFMTNYVNPVRRFASVETPYTKRDFPLDHDPSSAGTS